MRDQVAKPAALSTVVLAGRRGSTQSPERHLPNMGESLSICSPISLTRPQVQVFREEPAGKSVRERPLHLDIIETDLAAAYRSIYPARGKTLRLNVLPRLSCNLRTDAPAGHFDPYADGLM